MGCYLLNVYPFEWVRKYPHKFILVFVRYILTYLASSNNRGLVS